MTTFEDVIVTTIVADLLSVDVSPEEDAGRDPHPRIEAENRIRPMVKAVLESATVEDFLPGLFEELPIETLSGTCVRCIIDELRRASLLEHPDFLHFKGRLEDRLYEIYRK